MSVLRRAMVLGMVFGSVLVLVSMSPSVSARGSAPVAAVYPDVIEEVPSHLQIQNTRQREWLRFSTVHINIGAGNLQIRGGGQVQPCDIDAIQYDQCTVATQEILDAAGRVVATHPAGVAFFHPEHNHWHQSAVAKFAIRAGSLAGAEVATGVKITFCFVDVEFTGTTGSQKKAQPRTYFDCNGAFQGLASGWADSYHQSTPLQELDITGIPAGDYFLTHEADPENHWLEGEGGKGGEDNNFTWVKFRLSRQGANPEVTVIGHSPCIVEVQCGFGGNP